MCDKVEGIERFNYWSKCQYGMGVDVVLCVRINEDDTSFLSPFEWEEKINLFIKLRMSFSVCVWLRDEWGNEIEVVDNGIMVRWDDIEDEVLFEERLRDDWVRVLEFNREWDE